MRCTGNERALLLGATTVLLVTVGLARADTISIVATRDNTLYQDVNGRLSDGAGSYLFAGVTAQNQIRRGLVFFDIASNVPASATINSVELTLYASRVANNGAKNVSLHRTLGNWGEGTSNADGQEGKGTRATPGDATWLHTFYNSESWTTAGGDFSATASAVRSIAGTGSYTWSTATELVADVQSWLDDPATNFGWTIVGDQSTSSTAKRFDSRESATAQRRPHLMIDFTPPSLVSIGDYNGDGFVNVADVDLQAPAMADENPDLDTFDENNDDVIDYDDRVIWVHDHARTWVGDANLDGEFNSTDLIDVLAAGTYAADVAAGWAAGDFNGSGRFDSSDLIDALADGGYEQGQRASVAAVPEPSTSILLALGLTGIRRIRNRR